jgi:hypothetical protein
VGAGILRAGPAQQAEGCEKQPTQRAPARTGGQALTHVLPPVFRQVKPSAPEQQ